MRRSLLLFLVGSLLRVSGLAADTDPERIIVCAVHQHDAPVADLAAERYLRKRQAQGTVCDPAFHEIAVQRIAQALRESLSAARPVSHLGLGEALVERIASNRRYLIGRARPQPALSGLDQQTVKCGTIGTR
jgi:hypothetical protein